MPTHTATTGNLIDRVTIQQNTTTPDSQGGRASSWGTLATVWARVDASGAEESIGAEAIQSLVNYRVTIRYRADVSPSMRLLWTNYQGVAQTLEVRTVDLSPDAAFATLTCSEVRA